MSKAVIQEPEQILRVRTPHGKEVLGVLQQRLGASRTRVTCFDGKVRICRIPGRLKRRLWVREGDIVLVQPWEFGGEDRGDIIYKYTKNQVEWLKKKNHLKGLENIEEF
ncbi:translation initiation factor eIF-1A [Candidatus Woesearchaeota archaeon]|nr:translation initiation factor eIF-1A [Candidatus Woesearchaeota archaeon]